MEAERKMSLLLYFSLLAAIGFSPAAATFNTHRVNALSPAAAAPAPAPQLYSRPTASATVTLPPSQRYIWVNGLPYAVVGQTLYDPVGTTGALPVIPYSYYPYIPQYGYLQAPVQAVEAAATLSAPPQAPAPAALSAPPPAPAALSTSPPAPAALFAPPQSDTLQKDAPTSVPALNSSPQASVIIPPKNADELKTTAPVSSGTAGSIVPASAVVSEMNTKFITNTVEQNSADTGIPKMLTATQPQLHVGVSSGAALPGAAVTTTEAALRGEPMYANHKQNSNTTTLTFVGEPKISIQRKTMTFSRYIPPQALTGPMTITFTEPGYTPVSALPADQSSMQAGLSPTFYSQSATSPSSAPAPAPLLPPSWWEDTLKGFGNTLSQQPVATFSIGNPTYPSYPSAFAYQQGDQRYLNPPNAFSLDAPFSSATSVDTGPAKTVTASASSFPSLPYPYFYEPNNIPLTGNIRYDFKAQGMTRLEKPLEHSATQPSGDDSDKKPLVVTSSTGRSAQSGSAVPQQSQPQQGQQAPQRSTP